MSCFYLAQAVLGSLSADHDYLKAILGFKTLRLNVENKEGQEAEACKCLLRKK